jgi:hypothetical protein
MKLLKQLLLSSLAAVSVGWSAHCHSAVQMYYFDPDGVGVRDETPIAPSPTNPATTLGEARYNVMEAVAKVWGDAIDSPVPIRVAVISVPLSCNRFEGTLADSRPFYTMKGEPGWGRTDTVYPAALANKLSGKINEPTAPEIIIRLNSRVGEPDCIAQGFDYETQPSGNYKVNSLMVTVLHEMAHGLGFGPSFDRTTGEWTHDHGDIPDIFTRQLFDENQNANLAFMTPAQRLQSASSLGRVGWYGTNANAAVGQVLSKGPVEVTYYGTRQSVYNWEVAQFGFAPLLGASQSITGRARYVGDACNIPAGTLRAGDVAIADLGTCFVDTKALNVQKQGGAGLILVFGMFPDYDFFPVLGGNRIDEVKIPVVGMNKREGEPVRDAVATTLFSNITISRNANRYQGTTSKRGLPMMFTPSRIEAGSTLSHFDWRASKDLLMEPGITLQNGKLKAPHDLTVEALRDLGW